MTTKMAYNHQFSGGKNVTFNGDAEVTPDLHFRMSKKIAQLTKVIYSLKTKTDEYDTTIEKMKLDHQNQIQQLLQDTKVQLEAYQAKIRGELQMQRKIEALESNLCEFEHHKHKALSEFNEYRSRVEQREASLKTEHSERMLDLSQEVLAVKRDFETQMQNFSEYMKNAELNKLKAIEELELKHGHELEKIHSVYNSKVTDADSKISSLHEMHLDEIERLKSKFASTQQDHDRVIDDYELKLRKAQAFYEKELAALKLSQDSQSQAEAERLKTNNDSLKHDFSIERKQLNDRVEELLSQIVMAEQETDECRSEIKVMKISIQGHEDNVAFLNKQLSDLQNSHNAMVKTSESLECELSRSKQICVDQKQELLAKSKAVTRLEAKDEEQIAMISELKDQVVELQSQLARLDEENKKLFGSSMSTKEKNSMQLQDLKKALEKMTKEKMLLEERMSKELNELERSSTKKQTEMHNDFTSTIVTLEQQYKGQIDLQKKSSAQEFEIMKTMMEEKMADERQCSESKYSILKSEFEKVTNELNGKVEAAEAEVSRLNYILQNSELGLGAATTHISTLKEQNAVATKKLADVTEQLKNSQVTITSLQNEIEKLKSMRNSDKRKSDLVLKNKIQQITEDLDNKWIKQLSNENSRLHEELTAIKDTEKEKALCDLRLAKELELKEARDSAEQQIRDLQQKLVNEEAKKKQEIAALEKQWIDKGVHDTATEYGNKMAALEAENRNKTDALHADYLRQLRELERRLNQEHLEQLQSQTIAHKVVVESARADVDRQRLEEVTELKKAHLAQMKDARDVLLQRHNTEMDRLNNTFQQDLIGVKVELQKALDVAKEKERENSLCIEGLHEEITKRDQHIHDITGQLEALKRDQTMLSEELDSRSQLIQSIRAEADNKLQRQLDQCDESKKAEMSKLQEDHAHDVQNLMGEFHMAQEMLKDKIYELNSLLKEAEVRFARRESRPDDLECIHRLRETVAEREADIEHLKQEKKYYELELVNRETNFNKIFSSTQSKVSVLHAAPPKKKGGDKNLAMISPHSNTSSNNSSRLDPLPGSPFHDEKLNRVKPLPPPGLIFKKSIK